MSKLYLGLMSGTSLDGLDIALCQFEPSFKLLATSGYEIDLTLRNRITALSGSEPVLIDDLMLLERDLGNFAAECVGNFLLEHRIDNSAITAIGYHGQTIRHRPDLFCTKQIGDPSILAELCDIDVIADFRHRDMAAGGQGAPLVPAFHQYLTQHLEKPFALLNLGGIANLSIFESSGKVKGFDTGPANTLLDQWHEKHRNGRYDPDGIWAASGVINHPLLEQMLSEPYFGLRAPKSTGRELFNLEWLAQQLLNHPNLEAADIQTTLLELTAASIANGLMVESDETVNQLIVSGGGANNSQLMARLKAHLPYSDVITSDELGWPSQAIEASAFAWLAYAFTMRNSGNLPAVTGAKGERILGALYPH